MKKVKLMLMGLLLVGMSSCSTMLEDMDLECNEEKTQTENRDSIEFDINSKRE